MGMGTGAGERRAALAVSNALDSPLLDNIRLIGARHVLVNIVHGNSEPTMKEIKTITSYLQDQAGQTAKLKWGLSHNPDLSEELCVTVIATSFQDKFSGTVPVEESPEPEDLVHIPIDLEEVSEEQAPAPPFPPQVKQVNYPKQQTLNLPHQQPVTDDQLNTPAYLRMGVKLEVVPESDKQFISKMVLTEDENTGAPVLKKNSFYSNNPD